MPARRCSLMIVSHMTKQSNIRVTDCFNLGQASFHAAANVNQFLTGVPFWNGFILQAHRMNHFCDAFFAADRRLLAIQAAGVAIRLGWRLRYQPTIMAMTGMPNSAATVSSGYSRTTSDIAPSPPRNARSAVRASAKWACKLNVMPMLAVRIRSMAPTWDSPGSNTSSGRANTPAMSMNNDTQSTSARMSVLMNEASAILAVTAATTEVGGVSSPQTARKNAKKCTTQGSTPYLIIGGAITSAVRM